jgi:RimJ/RimL family protein N-acetyltransferase
MNYFLRHINKNDLNYFINIKQDNKVIQYLKNNKIYNINEITKWFTNLVNEIDTERFIIYYNDIPIGDICIGDINYNKKDCSLHIKILSKYWNLKIGSHVIADIINYCKNILKLKIINIEIHQLNINSINLFKKFNAIYINNYNNFNYYIINI